MYGFNKITVVSDGLFRHTVGFLAMETDMSNSDDMAAEVIRLRQSGMGMKQIARTIGKRTGFVVDLLKAHGEQGKPYYMTDDEKAQIKTLRLEGHSAEVIADSLGRSKFAVIEYLTKIKLNDRIIRPIVVRGDVAEIELTSGLKAIIDAEDIPLVQGRSWFTMGAKHKRYAATRDGGAPKTLHRFLMNPPDGMHVDHINGDGLDNRRSNLRLATPRENTANSRRDIGRSGYIGVQRAKYGNKFLAAMTINIGTFDTAEEAARAYDAKAVEVFGEFAMTNAKRGLLNS